MKKTVIITEDAPNPIGPYSQAVKYEDLIFVSGQIAIDPKTNQMISGGVKEQTEQVMKNIRSILKAADSTLNKILRATVYVRNLDSFTDVNEVFNDYLKGDHPSRETVEVSKLPKDADVEISVIAFVND